MATKSGVLEKPWIWQFSLQKPGIWENMKKKLEKPWILNISP